MRAVLWARFSIRSTMLTWIVCSATAGISAGPESDTTHTISGVVMEQRAGTRDVPVCLCDADSGLPVSKTTYRPLTRPEGLEQVAVVLSDQRGRFQFDNVPDGKYRLVAQKWTGEFKGIFELHGAVIQLMGVADDIVVPRPPEPEKASLALRPPGTGIVSFNQESGNYDTALFLSTSPLEFDPILGLDAQGPAFRRNVIGVNRMPLGQTIVIGVPEDAPLYAHFFAPDNSPGYATITVPPSKSRFREAPSEPFVAGWSNGRHTPPPELAELMQFMDAHKLSAKELLKIPDLSAKTHVEYRQRMEELRGELAKKIDLPAGKSARIGDILAADAYRRLAKP